MFSTNILLNPLYLSGQYVRSNWPIDEYQNKPPIAPVRYRDAET